MSNAAQAAWDHASTDPDRVALRGAGEPWTYGRLRDHAAAIAARLADAGVAPGDRVLLVAPSVPEFAGAYYGIHAAGAVAVTANTMSTRPELEYVGEDSGVKHVHPHKFRRTLATKAIDKGMPIEQVQVLLGHSKIDTTLCYAMVDQENVKRSHRKYIS